MLTARPCFSRILKLTLAHILLCGLAACGPQDEPSQSAEHKPMAAAESRTAAGNKTRSEHPAWPLGTEILADSIVKAGALNTAVGHLLDTPNLDNLKQAQRLWREAAVAIERFHLFSRLGTVAPRGFQRLVSFQFNLTAWPIQPGYLDGFGEYPYSGIVFDVGVPITAQVLREQHGMTDSSDATLGIYAMEFLLFGEHNNRGPLVFQPITALDEQSVADGYTSVGELPRNRRRDLVRLQAQLFLEDLTRLHDAWINNRAGTLKQSFELLTASQQAQLLRKAALALATEQLVVIANQQGADQWHSQQLADRLAAQLEGLARFNAVARLGERVATTTLHGITHLNEIRDLPPPDQSGLPKVEWHESYASLRELIKALNPSPPSPLTPDESDPLSAPL